MSKNDPPRDENDDVIVSKKNPKRFATKSGATYAAMTGGFAMSTTIVMFGAGYYIKRDSDKKLLCYDGSWRPSDPCPAA